MIIGIGTDLIEIPRIVKAIEQYGEKFLRRIFTDTERNYCEQFGDTKFLHYAARFAAKEAFSKAIGTGITDGFKFSEIGIRNEPNGKPKIELFGGLAKQWGDCIVLVTLSHSDKNATAFVIIEQC